MVRNGFEFAISVITKYEIYAGATEAQMYFWNSILELITIIPFDEAAVGKAVELNTTLKRKRKQIDLPDLFIASTALAHHLPLATLNRKHFERVDGLEILD